MKIKLLLLLLVVVSGCTNTNQNTVIRQERVEFVKVFYNGSSYISGDGWSARKMSFDGWSVKNNKLVVYSILGDVGAPAERDSTYPVLEVWFDASANQLPYVEFFYETNSRWPNKSILHLHNAEQVSPGNEDRGKFGSRKLSTADEQP